MARTAQLKVFRTPIGFHDAFVAAPSQKAALEAWGSDHNLFARGEAELVTDEALTREPLANPGKVIKRLRGTADEQFAALDAGNPPPSSKGGRGVRDSPPKRIPRPSRTSLDEAEAALAAAEERHAEERRQLAQEEAKLAKRRRAAEQAQEAERARLEHARDEAQASYDRAIEQWRSAD